MDRSLYVNTLTGKHIPLVRLLLAIKTKITNASFLYYYLAIFKLYGLIILTLGLFPTEESSYGYRLIRVLRSVTSFGILGTSITYSSYTFASYLILIFLLCSLGLFIYTFKQCKLNEDFIVCTKARVLSFILAIIFQVLVVLSQHLIEFASFIFMIQFNSGVDNTTSPTYYLIKDYALFMTTSLSFDSYLLMLCNFIVIILLNVFMYFAFNILNEPFFDTDFPVRMRYQGFSIIVYVIFQNLQCIHYVELFFVNSDTLKIYKFAVLGFVNFFLVLSFAKTYISFNFSSGISYLVCFFLTFAFFSSLIEILNYVFNNPIQSLQMLVFTNMSKLLISFSFLKLSYHFNEKKFITTLKTSLFQPYDGRIEKNDLESVFYIINLLIKLEKNNQVNDLNSLMAIILSHKNECVVDNCKCSAITDYKTQPLLEEINLILESIFANLNLGKEQFINICFAEYLYFLKKSTLFGWSIMNTYISKNTGLVRNLSIYQFFLIIMKKVHQFDDLMRPTEMYVHFNMVFREVASCKFYEKKILSFINNFESIVKFKERFDSSLKADHFEGKIDSHIFQTDMSQLTENCRSHQSLYKNMKAYIRKDFAQVRCKSVELGYRLYTFFTIFNKKVPLYIVGMICDDSTLDKTSNTAVCKYFNDSFHKFLSNTKNPMNMIVEINKMFKIKYVSTKICAALGHPYSKLINDDIHQLFPTQLREPHKNVLLNKFLIERNTFFRKKTFGFTSSNNMVALDLMVSCFPNLKKNLQAVVSVYPLETDDKKAFFFVITEFFELLAITENLDTTYRINYEVIDKLGISMVKLFDIESVIATKFKPHIEAIRRERYLKQFDHLYSLSWFLFNIKSEDDKPPSPPQNANPTKKSDPSNPNGGKKKEGGNELLGGLGGEAKGNKFGTKDKQKNKETKIGEEIIGNLDDLQESASLTPARGGQNILVDKNKEGTPEENSSTPYKNYNKDDKEDKSDDNQTPGANQGVPKEVKSLKELESDYAVIRDKRTIINNLEIIRNRIKDFETGYQYYERLCDSVVRLKKSCGIDEESTEVLSKSRKRLNINNNNNKNVKSNIKVSSSSFSENFNINISFRKINDSPFYLVGVKEKSVYRKESDHNNSKKQENNNDLSVIGEMEEEIKNETVQGENLDNNKIGKKAKNNKLKESTTTIDNESKAGRRKSSDVDSKSGKRKSRHINAMTTKEREAKKLEEEKKRIEEEKRNDTTAILDISKKSRKKVSSDVIALSQEKLNKQEAKQKSERKKEIITTTILAIFLVCNLVLAIIVFYFKLFVINVTEDIFIVNFWRLRHETIFTALHSACISYAFMLTGITTFQTKYLNSVDTTIPLQTLPLVINERSAILRETLAKLFSAVKNSRYKLTGMEDLLYSNVDTYKSMILTWDRVSYNSTYINMIDFIVTKSNVLSIETKLDEYILDINNALLFKQYDNLKNIKAASRHSVLLYFLNENIQKLEETFLKFKSTINESEIDLKDNVRQMASIIEIMNIVIGFVLIFVIHYTINKFDKNLFKILLSMFLNLRKGKKADFKGMYECEIIKLRMKNLRNLLYAFNVENIRQLDESLHIDQYSMNKLRMKNFIVNDGEALGGGLNVIHENADDNTGAPSKDPLLNATLGGSILGLNSSQTPLAASSSLKDLGLNEEIKDEKKDNNEDKGHDRNEAEKVNTNSHKKNEDKTSAVKKKKVNKEEEDEGQTFITNGQILKKTKHYSIRFVFTAKIIITIVFLIYIIFVISNVISNAMNLSTIDGDMALVTSYVMVYPEINRVYNMIRLSIMTNDISYTKKVEFYMNNYYKADADSNILYENFRTKLPVSHEYYSTINELDFEKRASYVCKNTVVSNYCNVFLAKANGYNKEGVKIATNTVITKTIDIYKDYMKIRDSNQPSQLASLTSQKLLNKYFNSEDFANINCEMYFVFTPTTISYFNSIQSDMIGIFDSVININVLLGIASIFLNSSIILYIVLIFFRKLAESQSYITYSSNKFNRALFEN